MFSVENLCRALPQSCEESRSFAVAYSGGMDSHALLHALMRARESHGFAVRALHFDHALQAESENWAAHCEAVCREWDIPFLHAREQVRARPGQSVEDAARRARYRWFAQSVARGETLLTAHHADDRAETLLLNALRGGGAHALAGIRPRRMLSSAKGTRVARPLLEFSRGELAEYARANGLRWIEDPSNRDLRFARNYLRHEIIPLLQRRMPGASAALARAAAKCHDAAELLDAALLPALEECAAPEKRGVFCIAPPLNANALQAAAQHDSHAHVRLTALLRLWLHRHGRRSPSDRQLRAFLAQVCNSRRAALLFGDTELRCFDGRIYMTRPQSSVSAMTMDWDLRARDLGHGLRIEMRRSDESGALAPRRLRGRKVQLIWRQGGERMTLPHRAHSHALKKLFQDRRVPPWERGALPLLAVDGEIAWAHGIGAGAIACARDGNLTDSIRPHFAAANC